MSLRVSTSRSLMPGLLGGHVQRRADHLGDAGEQRLVGQLLAQRLGHPEVDHLDAPASCRARRTRTLDGLRSRWMIPFWWACCTAWQTCDEQLQPLPRGQPVLVAELGDRHALDQLHHEVRPAGRGRPAVEHPGDVRVVHDRQGLPLGLEPGDHLPRVHPRLEHLQRDLAADRLGLLGHVDDAEPALADLLQQLVRADRPSPGPSAGGRGRSGRVRGRRPAGPGSLRPGCRGPAAGPRRRPRRAASPAQAASRYAARSAGGRDGERSRKRSSASVDAVGSARRDARTRRAMHRRCSRISSAGRSQAPPTWRSAARPGRTPSAGRRWPGRCPGRRPPARPVRPAK